MQRRIEKVCRALAHPLRRELLTPLSGRDDRVAELGDLFDRIDDPPTSGLVEVALEAHFESSD